MRGGIRLVFWTIVLAGVFVLGLGYGRTIADDAGPDAGEVTVTVPRDAVTVTLPTETVTVTRTVRAPARGSGGGRSGARDAG